MIKYIIFIFMTFFIAVIAQTNYTMKLTNPVKLTESSFQFDLTIKSNTQDFYLTSYQCSFSFDNLFTLSDSIKLTYIENSSELSNFPMTLIGHDTVDGINELFFVSGIGNDLVTQEEIMVGSFSIQGNQNFNQNDLNLLWNFTGNANTILTGKNFSNITDPTNHFNFNNNITDLENIEIIPNKFELSQNYPNPFNPTTKINFSLPNDARVKMIIFNILGEKVMDIVNEKFTAGKHTIEINGRNLSSGAYFYTIEAGEYKAVKKMILMK